jgi:DNA-binding response OmpR family regulator
MTKVLVVDDEPALLQMLKVNLEIDGFDTYLASDGETALKRIVAEEPDVVLLDLMMPVLDGWGVLSELREMTLRKHPKVIIMTAKGKRDLKKGLDMGASAYVTKPFETDDLLSTVREVMSLSDEQLAARRRAQLEEQRGWSKQ